MTSRIGLRRRHKRHKKRSRWKKAQERITRRYLDAAYEHLKAGCRLARMVDSQYRGQLFHPDAIAFVMVDIDPGFSTLLHKEVYDVIENATIRPFP